MKRRNVLIGLAALPAAAHPQQPRPLLAILSPSSPHNEVAMRNVNLSFKQALMKFGYEPGRNIDIVERFAEDDESRLPALAAELVALRPWVLFTHTSYAAAVAARATRSIPIVVGPAGETVLLELAGGNFARPTGNVTGFVLGSSELDDKCITLLIEAVPGAGRIGVLINPRNPQQRSYPSVLASALAVPGKTLIRLESGGPADIDAALARAAAQRIGALFVTDDALLAGNPAVRQRVLRFAAAAGIAVASCLCRPLGRRPSRVASAFSLRPAWPTPARVCPSCSMACIAKEPTCASSLASPSCREFARAALRHRLPSVVVIPDEVDAGGLITYWSDEPAQYRRAAAFLDRILKGAKPADLPVEQPTRFELVVNLETAKALGIQVPAAILLRADRVIE